MQQSGMRDKIKVLALELLIKHGYRGVSFGDLAEALLTTRANIHYHFGNKQKLVEQVLEDYVEQTSADLGALWTRPDTSMVDKIRDTVEYSRKRYRRFNPPGHTGHPWSLISRMRQDSDALTPKGRAALQRFGQTLFGNIAVAIEDAKARGEFDRSMPTDDVALQLVSIANSAGPITQDAGSFGRLEDLYIGFARIIMHAYGKPGRRPRRAEQPVKRTAQPRSRRQLS